jgi:hypothetical protein
VQIHINLIKNFRNPTTFKMRASAFENLFTLSPMALRKIAPSLSVVFAALGAVATSALTTAPAQAAFSTDKNNPTVLSFLESGISIMGTVSQPAGPSATVNGVSPDAQYVTFTVPDGYAFSRLILTDYSSTDQRGFIALQAGSQWTSVPASPALPGSLAFAHFGTGNSGTRPVCALSYAGSTATPTGSQACAIDAATSSDLFTRNLGNTVLQSLPAGPYTLWIQQTNVAPVSFTFQAQFSAVPGPLPVLGAAAAFSKIRRLRNLSDRLSYGRRQGQGA